MSAYRTPGEATTPIIIRTPAPDTEERLVLVPLDACSEVREDDPRARLGARVGLTVLGTYARDATAADLERAGWVKREVPSAEAWKAAHAEAERELIRARAALAEQPDPGTLAHLRADLRDAVERADTAEADNAKLRVEVERLTAPGEGSLDNGGLVAAITRGGSYRAEDFDVLDLQAAYRLGVAHERAKDRAERCLTAPGEAEPVGVAMLRKLKERAEKAERERDALRTDLDAERRRADAIERANVELHEKLAQADRELDGACSPDCQARIDYVEADNAKLRVEVERLTAPGEGEPTDNELRAVWDPEPTITAARRALFRLGVAHERAKDRAERCLTAPGEGSAVMSSGLTEAVELELMRIVDGAIGPLPEIGVTLVCRGHASGAAHTVSTAAYRLGVAHERARHGACCPLDPDMPVEAVDADLRAAGVDPEALAARGLAFVRECQRQLQGRATEDELVALYRKVYETHGGRTIDVSHDDCRRAAVAAVAAHVRKERCLVAQAVGMGADVRITRSARAVAWDIDVTRRPVAPGARYVHEVKAADVPSTLARLLGEVSK